MIKSGSDGNLDTRVQIILTAERLFAEYGLAGVSLRRINNTSGQKNTSATHYHFDNKEGIVEAIFSFRQTQINKRRLDIRRRMLENGQIDCPRALVGAMVYPLTSEMLERGVGSYYLRFVERVFRDSKDLQRVMHRDAFSGWRLVNDDIRRALKEFPEIIRENRVRMLQQQMVGALAEIESIYDDSDGPLIHVFVEDVIDMLVASVFAPISEETKAELCRSGPSPT